MTDFLTTSALELLLVSFGVGIVVGLTGMGGGALMTPALVFLGIPPTTAVANDLVAAGVNKTIGAITHCRAGAAHWPLVKWLVIGSVPTAFAGGFIVHSIGGGEDQQHWLKMAVGVTLIFAALSYAARMAYELRRDITGMTDSAVKTDVRVRVPQTLAVGAIGGLLVGITSVGAGSLMMIALVMLYPMMNPRKLVGTDLLQAVPLVIAAAASHVISLGVDWKILLPLLIGGMPGTYLGARCSPHVPQSVTRRGIAIVLLLTGLSMLKVPPVWVGYIGVGALLVGPTAWVLARNRYIKSKRPDLVDEHGHLQI